ncbi:MAG: hypothetical protein EOP51_26065, partial [Sphingobacteriales bacterium]
RLYWQMVLKNFASGSPKTWDTLITEFYEAHASTSQVQDAISELKGLSQGNSTVREFYNRCVECGFGNERTKPDTYYNRNTNGHRNLHYNGSNFGHTSPVRCRCSQ